MANKKDKPALFELVDRGPLRPNKTGSLKTPPWFYQGSKTQQSTTAPSPQPAKPAPAASPQPAAATSESYIEPGEQESEESWYTGRLEIRVSYWIVALALVTLLVALLAAYLLGQRSGRAQQAEVVAAAVDPLADAPASGALDEVRQRPIRNGLVPKTDRKPVNNSTLEFEIQPERASTTSAARPNYEAPIVTQSNAQRLLMCRHEVRTVLEPVRNHFSKSGIETLIGRFRDQYVLVSKDAFESSRVPAASILKKQVAKIGALYNSSKPAGVPGFTASTFESAYWVNSNNIEFESL